MLYRSAFIVFFIIAASTPNMHGIAIGLEVSADGSHVTRNGQRMSDASFSRDLVEWAFSFVGATILNFIAGPDDESYSFNRTRASIAGGNFIGSICADAFYANLSTKRVLYKSARAFGYMAGHYLDAKEINTNNIIDDLPSLCGSLGTIAVYTAYSDRNNALLTAGGELGYQVTSSFSHNPTEKMTEDAKKGIGRCIGQGVVAHCIFAPATHGAFRKETLYQAASFILVKLQMSVLNFLRDASEKA